MSFGPSHRSLPDGTFSAMPGNKQLVISQIVEAHEMGIQVYLMPTFWSPNAFPDRSKAETYLENFTPIVLEWADIAQQYGVALFSPVNEPDHVFPQEIVATWLQDIIPKINERYHGLTSTTLAHLADMDFSGYDYVGFNLIGPRASEEVRELAGIAKKYAERDGARGVIAEYGVLFEDVGYGEGEGVGGERQAEAIDHWFQESLGEVDGHFIVSWLLPGYSVKGRPAEQVIEKWFTAEADEPAAPIVKATQRPSWSPLSTKLQGCQEKDVIFSVSPIDVEFITAVQPQGLLTSHSSGHITPGDHVMFRYDADGPALNLYAAADGYLKRVERQPSPVGFGVAADVKHYHLYFEYSCTLFGSYVHVTELAPELAAADQQLQELDAGPQPQDTTSLWPNIPVQAGQLIGKTEYFGLLEMLTVDTNVTLPGFVIPSHYDGESWKIHAVPAFDYFAEPLRSQILAKNPRTKEPVGGKIDFDVDGTLAGNWFVEGTDYRGDAGQGYCGDYLCPYWNTHLAFVYDYVDPDQIRVAIGFDPGLHPQGPHGVKGNAPDPKTVSVDSGLVTYQLVDLENRDADFGITTRGGPLVTRSTDNVVGVLLVQMLDDRTIKMEVFPEATSGQGLSFSDAAKVYQR